MATVQHNHLDTAFTTGVVLIAAMIAGFVWANSPWQDIYRTVHHLPVHIRLGPIQLDRPLVWWVNEGLMVFFFLLVGLGIKREMVSGHLSSWRMIAIPAVAALSGMIAPAVVFLAFVGGDPVLQAGWAIPTATDIVLVLGLLAFLGDRVPVLIKVFLTALAIFDDIGAVLVIGVFYGHGFQIAPLLLAAGTLMIAAVWLRLWQFSWTVLIILGLILWVAFLQAGVEGAIAGILIALLVPFERGKPVRGQPLAELEIALKPWVFWGVVPIFALFNTGINIASLSWPDLLQPVTLGILFALLIGKPLGIVGAVMIMDRLGLSIRTDTLGWRHIVGAGLLAGVGFTISVFIASIAFDDPALVVTAKLAILLASSTAGLLGLAVLTSRRHNSRFKSGTGPT